MARTIRREKRSRMNPATLACGMVLAMLAVQAGVAQQAVKSPVAQPAPASARPSSAFGAVPFSSLMPGAVAPEANREGAQGIKIHGHWVIDVRNPDGTLAQHRDFENALTAVAGGGNDGATGDQMLLALLSGNAVPSDPAVAFIQATGGASSLTGADPTSLCLSTAVFASVGTAPLNPTPAGVSCYGLTTTQSLFNLVEALNAPTFPLATGLGVTATFAPTVSWVLAGNYTIPAGLTSVNAVQTLLPVCATSTTLVQQTGGSVHSYSFTGSGADGSAVSSPSACTAYNFSTSNASTFTLGPLTYYVLPTAMPVTPGQILAVTVTITFS
jgi:hypothetical protein